MGSWDYRKMDVSASPENKEEIRLIGKCMGYDEYRGWGISGCSRYGVTALCNDFGVLNAEVSGDEALRWFIFLNQVYGRTFVHHLRSEGTSVNDYEEWMESLYVPFGPKEIYHSATTLEGSDDGEFKHELKVDCTIGQKDIDFVVKVMAALQKKRHPELVLKVYGSFLEYESEIMDSLKRSGLGKMIPKALEEMQMSREDFDKEWDLTVKKPIADNFDKGTVWRFLPEKWIIPCNVKYYDVVGAFEKLPRLDWKQSGKSIAVGDEVYIYVGSPIKAVLFRCNVAKVNLPKMEIDDSEFWLDSTAFGTYGNYMELELVERYGKETYSLAVLKERGLKGNIQGPRRAGDLFDK